MDRFRVVICGGGVAGIEALLRIHRTIGSRAEITLLCPNENFDYPPLSVLEPFDSPVIRTFPISRIASDTGATWIADALHWVDLPLHQVHSQKGQCLTYDALLLAPGGRQRPVNPSLEVFTADRGPDMYRTLLRDLGDGNVKSLAFVVPAGPTWPLPLYELALLTARRAHETSVPVELSLVIPGRQPLGIFGGKVSETVTALLRQAGIDLYQSATSEMPDVRRLVLTRAGIELHPDRTITVPQITGPDVKGIPGDPIHRFIRIDQHCRVKGTDGRVFGAGDATDFPVKLGGIGAQQADTAADGIAHLAGAGPPGVPLLPIVRAVLVGGKEPLYLFAHVIDGRGWQADVYEQPPWGTPDKIIAHELGCYLPSLAPDNPLRTLGSS